MSWSPTLLFMIPRASACRRMLGVVRLTWKPLLGALFCAVVLGALIDHFAPQVHSLPGAVRAILHH